MLPHPLIEYPSPKVTSMSNCQEWASNVKASMINYHHARYKMNVLEYRSFARNYPINGERYLKKRLTATMTKSSQHQALVKYVLKPSASIFMTISMKKTTVKTSFIRLSVTCSHTRFLRSTSSTACLAFSVNLKTESEKQAAEKRRLMKNLEIVTFAYELFSPLWGKMGAAVNSSPIPRGNCNPIFPGITLLLLLCI